MKKDKDALYNNRILKCLLSRERYTISQIADQVGLSEKTIRTKINQINDWLESRDFGRIQKKQGTGIWLDLDERQASALEEWLGSGETAGGCVDLENRDKQLMGKLLKLKSGEMVTIGQLADSLYLSPPTVSNLLRGVSDWFESRGLAITSVRNKGICLAGEEYNRRRAMKDYILYVMPEVEEALLGTYAAGVDIYRVRKIIVEAESAWRIELADTSFDMVWIMACLSISRIHTKGEHKFKEHQEEDIQRYNEYAFAESIYQRISREFHVGIPDGDILLLAVLLLSAKKLGSFNNMDDEDCMRQYDRELSDFVKLVIETIDSVLDVELADDKTLYESLLLHMRSAIFRMKYSTSTSETLSKYVKNEYKQTFLATWSTSNLFEEYYGVQVTEDELAGIALYIQAALIRRRKNKPLAAVLVSHRGLASSHLIMEMLKYSLPEISEIRAVSHHDFKFSGHGQADLIISTVELNVESPKIVYIGDRVSEQIVEAVKDRIKELTGGRGSSDFRFHNLCHQLFEMDLILVRPKVKDKSELITMMVEKLEEQGDVTGHYLESVFDREKATTTSIGRGIAIPHGNMMEINESRVAVAILEDPIEWRGDLVDVVFLLALKMTSKFEIQRTKQFYKDFLVLTENNENLETMKKMGSALELYQFFIR